MSTSHIVRAADGRTLAVHEAGRRDGVPVLVHHGTPGSAVVFPGWVADAETHGIRLISYDRAGYGESTPNPRRDVASIASDVAAIAGALGIGRLYTWGISGGGPHALACAALLPELIVAAVSVAGPAPYEAEGLDWLGGMGDDNIVEFGAALEGRATLEPLIETLAGAMLAADANAIADGMRTLLTPVDRAALNSDMAQFLTEQFRRGVGTQREGWIDDDLAFTQSWGFDVGQIRVPLMIMHGGQDKFVPLSHGEWLVGRIPHVEPCILPEQGHLSLISNHISDVHGWLLQHPA